MRRDVDRIFLHPRNLFTSERVHGRVLIGAAQAIVLALFDGQRSIHDVGEIISHLLNTDMQKATEIVISCLQLHVDFIVEVTGDNEASIIAYRPEDFVITRNSQDLTTDHLKIPDEVLYVPTYSCSFHCRYCYAPQRIRSANEMPLQAVERFVAVLGQWSIPTLIFSGGDPFNHSHITEIVAICRANGIMPFLSTKSILPPSMIASLLEHNVRQIQVSVDSLDQAFLHRLSCLRDYPELVVRQIPALIAEGFEVVTNTVVTADNVSSIPSLIQEIIGMGVKQLTLSQYGRSRFRHRDDLFCDGNALAQLKETVHEFETAFPGVRFKYTFLTDPLFMSQQERTDYFSNRPICNAGRTGFAILPDGKVTICETLYDHPATLLGNLSDMTLDKMWFSERRFKLAYSAYLLQPDSYCARCSEAEKCHRIRGKCHVRALQAFGDTGMPDPYCPMSPPGKRIL